MLPGVSWGAAATCPPAATALRKNRSAHSQKPSVAAMNGLQLRHPSQVSCAGEASCSSSVASLLRHAGGRCRAPVAPAAAPVTAGCGARLPAVHGQRQQRRRQHPWRTCAAGKRAAAAPVDGEALGSACCVRSTRTAQLQAPERRLAAAAACRMHDAPHASLITTMQMPRRRTRFSTRSPSQSSEHAAAPAVKQLQHAARASSVAARAAPAGAPWSHERTCAAAASRRLLMCLAPAPCAQVWRRRQRRDC